MRMLILGLAWMVALWPFFAAHAADLDGLAALLRPIILDSLPNPLYEKRDNWGRTSLAPSQIRWDGLRPVVVKKPKNDGTWRHLKVSADNPAGTFLFQLKDFQTKDANRQTFTAHAALDVLVEFRQQVWESGVRLYSGHVTARARLYGHFDCENELRFERNAKSFVPDAVVRLRVVKSNVGYHNLRVEHLAGIGGSGARIAGEALHDALNQWRPSLERELLEKANAAVIKAADTREIRLSVDKLLKVK
ncbi:MAG: hypothetical protein L0Y72_10500 [Gemmataceae bacterium]|nr:hypothetical protein [Gemmataceae bacterium]MCI0739463.1 hypothetical protein [Gemmataceae bacterium]